MKRLLSILKWPLITLKELIIGKFLGGQVRHLIGYFGGFLAGLGVLGASEIETLTELLVKLLSSEYFWESIIALISALSASVWQKLEAKKELETASKKK